MPLILAIEPDRRQAAQIKSIVHKLNAELVLADTADAALQALGERVPDLILTPALLPPRDETVLNDRLRALERAALFVQTLTVPMLAAPTARKRGGGMLSALRRDKSKKAVAEGCDPAVFAEQCAEYLDRATAERESHTHSAPHAAEARTEAPKSAGSDFDGPFVLRDFYVKSTDTPVAGETAPAEPPPSTVDNPTDISDSGWDHVPARSAQPEAAEASSTTKSQETTDSTPADSSTEPAEAPSVARPVAPVPQRLGARQLWPSSQAAQDDQTPVDERVGVDSDAVLEGAVHEEELSPPPKAKAEPADTGESQNGRDDDLQIFDLDLGTLDQGPDDEAVAAQARQASQQTTGGDDARRGAADESAEAEEADLQVYDLDLSALLGNESQEEPSETDAPSATLQGTFQIGAGADQTPDAGEQSKGGISLDDEIEVYDLDLDSLSEQPHVVQPAARQETRAVAQHTAPVEKPRPAAVAALPPKGTRIESRYEEEPTLVEKQRDEQSMIDSGMLAPLKLGAHQLWPRLEGGVAKPPRLAVVGPAEAPAVAVLPVSPPEPKRPDWLRVLKSLRRDRRPQAETDAAPGPTVQTTLRDVEISAKRTEAAVQVQQPQPPPRNEPTPAPKVQADASEETLSKTKKRRLARKAKKRNRIQQEWGFFDPEQVGFEALLMRLDEVSDTGDERADS